MFEFLIANRQPIIKAIVTIVPIIIILIIGTSNPWLLPISLISFLIVIAVSKDYFINFYQAIKQLFKQIFSESFWQADFITKLSLILKAFNMNSLVSLSCGLSILYSVGLFLLGLSVPLLLLIGPLVTLAALNISMLLKNFINFLVNRKTIGKFTTLKADLDSIKLFRVKDSERAAVKLSDIKAGYIITIEPASTKTVKTVIPFDCKLISAESGQSISINTGTVTDGEAKPETVEINGKLTAGSYYLGRDSITVQAITDHQHNDYYHFIQAAVARFDPKRSAAPSVQANQSTKSTQVQSRPTFINRIKNLVKQQPVNILAFGVIVISVLSSIVWTILSGLGMGLGAGLDVLFAACPCVLMMIKNLPSLFTKKTLSMYGIVIHDDSVVTRLHTGKELDTIVFDKTETLTSLSYSRTDIHTDTNKYIDKLIRDIIYSAQQHRLQKYNKSDRYADLIVSSKDYKPDVVNNFDSDIEHQHNGIIINKSFTLRSKQSSTVYRDLTAQRVLIGNREFIEKNTSITLGDKYTSDQSAIYTVLLIDGKYTVYSSIYFSQVVRPEARDSVRSLIGQYGVENIHMLTGDCKQIAEEIGQNLGINLVNIRSRCSHVDKAKYISDLQDPKKQGRTVLFCGDGGNDVAAAKQADLAVAMDPGSDLSGWAQISIKKLDVIATLKQKIKTASDLIASNKQQLYIIIGLYLLVVIVLAAIVFPMGHMVAMMACFGICMAASSLVVTAWSSLVVPTIQYKFRQLEDRLYSPVAVAGRQALACTVPGVTHSTGRCHEWCQAPHVTVSGTACDGVRHRI